ncbi:MAG: glycosyltransferase family 2 protein [Richelia sp. RM2_1_2]|nr:glycosyltransferase family 2 protein [Richelia sp. SM1_7_0]NJN08805.1 glycosyltransferase family 2 protein [Richelia sp. RM1_1_1]NJO28746.1 glycosyltransferase family 2 protein [Richelia sp. SL_2_1]NJO62462.1 glycosyltransferase family 2 protein [Richelia sp. RM2_1_2]
MVNNSRSFVSIIIPVYNDSQRLATCLKSLDSQTYPKDLYEIVVVDNNSQEDIKSIVKQFNQARITHESRGGSYAARNKGISVAKGKILGFTDSDCIPAADWIEKGVEKLLQIPNCGLVAGEVKLFFKNPENPSIFEVYDSMNFLRQKYYIDEFNFGATANVFTFKEVFEIVGLFNSDLKSGGDKEWGQRVFLCGYTQVYAENVLVEHPARKEWKEIRNKAIRVTEGLCKQEKERKSLIKFIIEILRELKYPIKRFSDILNNNSLGIMQKIILMYLFVYIQHIRSGKKVELYLKDIPNTYKLHQHKEKLSN